MYQDSDSDSDSLFNINMYILCENKTSNNSDNYLVYTRIIMFWRSSKGYVAATAGLPNLNYCFNN